MEQALTFSGERSIPPTFKIAVRVWWSLIVRMLVLLLLIGVPLVMAMNWLGLDALTVLLGPLVAIAMEMHVLGSLLRGRYGSFRLAVFVGEQEVQPTLKMAVRFWWAQTWRIYVFTLPLTLLQNLLNSEYIQIPYSLLIACVCLFALIALFTTFYVFYLTISRDYGSFRIEILSVQPDEPSKSAECL
jgi:hypothetical protein